MRSIFLIFFFLTTCGLAAQNYTSYFTGNAADLITEPAGGICLMGGATEDDQAMKWFQQRANGGDILVLRASGSDGYNDYLFSDLGIEVNSVETIVFQEASAAQEPYIHQKIQQAEAIWFAGGDQWNYISYWRNTPIDSLINAGIQQRNVVVGGTSAGMAILGGFYFSAENGTIRSSEALANPYHPNITVDSTTFLKAPYLSEVITDTHYDDPDRKGRHTVFLSRILTDYGIAARGIACDEYTAVCIDTTGMARVFGNYPQNDDNAYFIQSNCQLEDMTPETIAENQPLHWNRGKAALKVYVAKGTPGGTNTFDLNDWIAGLRGDWETWYVDNGQLIEQPSPPHTCGEIIAANEDVSNTILIYPNSASDMVTIKFASTAFLPKEIHVINALGQPQIMLDSITTSELKVNTDSLNPGTYLIEILYDNSKKVKKLIIE